MRSHLQNEADLLELVDTSERARTALERLQRSDGSWEGEVVWCPVITAQAVILRVIAGRSIKAEERRLLLRQFEVTCRPGGGWGLHPLSSSYCFVTALVYVAARLLGAPPALPMLAEASAFLRRQPDGLFGLPQWGKVWLSFVGIYEPRGLNPCPPELFLLPRWLPVSPLRFYCHTRYIYLAIAYLVGSGFKADLGPVVNELRNELYGDRQPSFAIQNRHALAETDVYVRPGRLLRLLYDTVRAAGAIASHLPGARLVRKKALDSCHARIVYEQRQSGFQGLSPVSGILNTLALFSRDPCGHDTVASLDGVESWCWRDEAEGIRYAGARSTTWDTSFAIQALLAQGAGPSLKHAASLRLAYRRLADMQMMDELPDRQAQGRDSVLGGWCFSDGMHRWPVSDCAAETVIALLDAHGVPGLIEPSNRIPGGRLAEACEFILSRQNSDGGFGTYERRRGQEFLERLNPSEMFGQCMTELSYLECTASSVRALLRLRRAGHARDNDRAGRAIERGISIIFERQQADGSWPGFWGINFVYGTLFAIAALHDAGLPPHHPAIDRARRWLEQTQQADGGWGEHFSGCLTGSYVANPDSLIISTAWACLGLMHAGAHESSALQRGIDYLLARQAGDGSWPNEGVNGVFFGTAMLEYRLYNSYFPTMALGLFESLRHGG